MKVRLNITNTYVARRSIKSGSQETTFRIHKVDYDGNAVPNLADIYWVCNPFKIAKYFFDGEHAENFHGAANKQNVGRAVKNILGCGVLETAILDLEVEEKRLDREFKSSLRGQGAEEARARGLEKIKHLEQIDEGEDIIRTESQLIDIRADLRTKKNQKLRNRLREVKLG